MKYGITLALTAMAVIGCSTVRRAHEAQEAVEAKGAGVAEAEPQRFDLRGSSLQRLVEFAMTNRPSVVSARLAVEDARLALKALAADAPIASMTPWTAPELSVYGNYAETSGQGTFKDLDLRTEGGPSAGISLELPLWDFGRYNAKAKAQSERVLAAERTLTETGFNVFDEVATAYFDYLEKCALNEVALNNRAEYAEHLNRAEARLDAGEAHKLDVLKAKLDLAKANETLVSSSNQMTTAGATLMNTLGIDAAHGTCAEVIGPSPYGLAQVRRGFARTTYGLSEAFELARTNAPAMQIARANLRAASSDVDYAVRDMLPEVNATIGISWVNPLWAWNWGVNVAQSLFQGFRKTTAVERATVALKQAATDVDAAEQQLSLNLDLAIVYRDDSKKAIETALASIASAKENLEMVQQQLQVGAASRIELSAAISSLSTAQGSCITAFYTGQTAEAKLFRLMGLYPTYREETVTSETK